MTTAIRKIRDPNTLSNYQDWVTTHTTAHFDVDFEKKTLSGNVVLNLKPTNKHEEPEILLDTSYLDIRGVSLNGLEAKHELISRFEPYGSALKIQVSPDHGGEDVELKVRHLLP